MSVEISIGMPVYNAERTVSEAIRTILNQSFKNFELIISDNASSDDTENICRKYAQEDSRITYIRQDKNIGTDNFIFVYKKAIGEFFMWAPAHYSRSSDFIEENIKILKEDVKCNFVSTPNCWIDNENDRDIFSFEGSAYNRIVEYLDVHMKAHACFYGLFRRSSIEGLESFSNIYIAFDNVFIVQQLLKSEFKRTKKGLLKVGKGQSADPDYISTFQTRPIHYLFPYYDFSKNVISMLLKSKDLSSMEKFILSFKVFILNFKIYKMIIRYWLVKLSKKVGVYEFIKKIKK